MSAIHHIIEMVVSGSGLSRSIQLKLMSGDSDSYDTYLSYINTSPPTQTCGLMRVVLYNQLIGGKILSPVSQKIQAKKWILTATQPHLAVALKDAGE